jgi:hypothetical protein
MQTSFILRFTGGFITFIWGAAELALGVSLFGFPHSTLFIALTTALGIWGVLLGIFLMASVFDKGLPWTALVFSLLGLATLQGLLLGPALAAIGSALAVFEKRKAG